MGSYSGNVLIGPGVASENIISASLETYWATPPTAIDVDEPTEIVSGAHVSNLPVGMLENSFEGAELQGFRNDYYYRIHVTPAKFSYGAILAVIHEEFVVWNAWFTEKECVSIVEVNPDEYTLTGLTAPFVLNGLAWTEYTIDIAVEGSPTFVSTITFDYVTELPVVEISGTRLVLFPWCPRLPIIENLEWLTDIIIARSGVEQRISVRQVPRQSFRLNVLLQTEQEQAILDAALFTWQKKSWGLPIWPEAVEHTDDINTNDTIIYLNTTNADFRDDSLAVIWQSPTEAEVIRIDTVTDSQLNLDSPVVGTFMGTKFIAPVRIAQMNTQVTRKDAPDGYSICNFSFLIRDNAAVTGYATGTTYKTLPVLTAATYVRPNQERVSRGDIVITDFESGKFNIFSDSDFNLESQSHLFKQWTRAECWNHRQFLHALYGMQGIVWIPSWKEDMELTQQIGAFDVNFNIANIGLADNMGVNTLRKHLAFIFPDDTILYREIMGITESGVEEIITIDSDLGLEVDPGDCIISFLDKYRLASDEIELRWDEPNRNASPLNFLRVRD